MTLTKFYSVEPDEYLWYVGQTKSVNDILFDVAENREGDLVGIMQQQQTEASLTWEDSTPTDPPTVGGGGASAEVYTAGTLPVGTQGDLVFVTDGDSGELAMATYDGSDWRRVVLGSVVSAT